MKKMLLLIVIIILFTGCTFKKCIKSHEIETTCTKYTYISNGKTLFAVPVDNYSYVKTVCDEYEK